ncbi:U3 snoRNP protein [Ceratobasidium sp. 392]|nr:U3 snoRNP protein [Ceratobasidium sp. 392]
MDEDEQMMDIEDTPRKVKKFTFRSYEAQLKDIHAPSKVAPLTLEQHVEDTQSHFQVSLDQWRQLNLSPSFLAFANKVDNLSGSFAMLLHHWEEIIRLWSDTVASADEEAFKPLIELSTCLIYDLRQTLLPAASQILTALLSLLARKLAPDALELLLTALTAHLKYLVVTNPGTLLEPTWSAFLSAVSPPHVRMLAEVWGHLLRKLKKDDKRRTSGLLVSSLEREPEFVVWCVVEATRSKEAQGVYTTATELIGPLLEAHVDGSDSTRTLLLLRRVLTALIHHSKTESFAGVVGVVVARLEAETARAEEMKSSKGKGKETGDEERLTRAMEVAIMICAVRKGGKLTSVTVSTLLALVPRILAVATPNSETQATYRAYAVAALVAGDMAAWIGPRRRALDAIWKDPVEGMRIAAILSELGWGGWKSMVLPHVLRRTSETLISSPAQTLSVLAHLYSAGRLDVDSVWIAQVGPDMLTMLQNWNVGDSTTELLNILTLSPLLPNTAPDVSRVVTLLHTAKKPDDIVLGAALKTLAGLNGAAAEVGKIELMEMVEKWGWSESVMDALVEIQSLLASKSELTSLSQLLPHLLMPLASHSRILRSSALQLLSGPYITRSSEQADTLSRLVAAEDVPLTVQGVRERVVKTGKVVAGSVAGDGIKEVVVRWLVGVSDVLAEQGNVLIDRIAQLKINLRPLWAPAIQALSTLASTGGCAEEVWSVVFGELERVCKEPGSFVLRPPEEEVDEDVAMELDQGPELDQGKSADVDAREWQEEEKTWRCPSAAALVKIAARWRGDCIVALEAPSSPDRLDLVNYETQLLLTLGGIPSIMDKHTRSLVPLFFEYASPTAPVPTKPPRAKTMAWLTMLSKLGNPKAAFRSQELHELYTILLSHPDRPLQTIALTCLLTFKETHVLAVEQSLRMFLDETKWRDEMTSFSFSPLDGELRARAVEVVIRLLYGTMLEKNRRDRKYAVLTLLSTCSSEELGTLVQLMLTPFEDALLGDLDSASTAAGGKQRTGYLVLLANVLKNLGPKLLDYWPQLLRTTMVLLRDAQAYCKSSTVAVEEDIEEVDEPSDEQVLRQARLIRQTGLKRFVEFFRSASAELFDFSEYVPVAFRWFISPRVPLLSRENTQAPSGIMDLFYTWSLDSRTALYLVDYDPEVLPQTFNCLTATNVKPAVVLKVFDITHSLLDQSEEHEEIRTRVVDPHMSHLLAQLAAMVEQSSTLLSTNDLIQRQLRILCQVAPYISDEGQATRLLSLLSPMLRRPAKAVSEKIKIDLLGIVKNALPLVHALKDRTSETYQTTYKLVSTLFQSLRTRPARAILVDVFEQLATVDETLVATAHIVTELNACSMKRMDEADFDRRLTAFGALNEELHGSLTCDQWLPLLYNMLFFIQDPEELSIRSSASLSLKRFVDLVAAYPAGDYEKTFVKVLYPGLRHGLRSKFELVRIEILGVLAHAITICDSVSALAQLRPLLADGDDEANFFLNVHHIQVHRRTRALRRLADFAVNIRSTTLSDVFMPLVGNFIEAVSTTDHLLVNEAIVTIGRMAAHLTWGSYNTSVQQYLRLARERVPTTEKAMIRTVVSILDHFHFKMGESVEVEKPEAAQPDIEENDALEAEIKTATQEAKKLARIEEAVTTRLLPSLLQYLEKRDETEEAVRIPVAIGIARVAMHLPDTYRGPQISKLVVVLSQILRSKSQEVRDLTRETLCKIAVIIGSESLALVIKELRGALTRGPQLHVLAFVAHSILVHVTTGEHATNFTVLDSCVSDIAHISAEVIFGQSGKDVQSEEFKTKMREVRSSASKGLDSFMIVAKHVTASRIAALLTPIRAIMHETVAIKPMQQAEDALRRIASGLNANANLKPVDTLVLCHTLIGQNAKFLKQAPAKKHNKKQKTDFDVELKRNAAPDTDFYSANSLRFVAFGLDLFITGFRRGRFDFGDPEIIARLEPMVVVIGNTLYSPDGHVVTLGLKAATSIVKCPLQSINKSLPAFVKQILEIIRNSGNTESEVVQTGLKSLAIIIRDCPAAKLQEKDLTFLLEVITPDLEEPERQAAVFSLLRAIIARKFVVPEIYDLMIKVSEMLVTNQSTQVQELSRSTLLQFLLDYPQGKGRLRTQLNNLARNLDYVFDSGRKSVMELLSAVFAKFTDAVVDEYAEIFFVALVLRIANDDTPKCREMAAALIQQLLLRVGESRRKSLLMHVHKWAEQEEKDQLAGVAAQVYGLSIDALHSDAQPLMVDMVADLRSLVQRSAYTLNYEVDSMDIDSDEAAPNTTWQVAYHALTSLGKAYKVFPNSHQTASTADWEAIFSHLLFAHAWVRLAACRLVGSLFASIPISASALDLSSDLSKATISNPNGSSLHISTLIDIAQKLCLQLRGVHLDETLSTQVVKNLFYIGKTFALVYELAGLGEEKQAEESDTDEGIDANEESEEPDDSGATKALVNPLAWLFSKLSYQARSAHIARLNRAPHSENWHIQVSSVLRWFAAMASHLPAPTLEQFFPHILAPVYRISEEETIKEPQLESVKTLAHELQALLQQRTGTTAFANAYSRIRQGVVRVRRERKIQRATQVATHPEAAARRKLQRNIAKKEGRKRKDRSFADAKIRNNAVKRRRGAEEMQDRFDKR